MANPFYDKNISNIIFLTCFGPFGWRDRDRIISICIQSLKVAKESTVGCHCSWHYWAKLCQWKCGSLGGSPVQALTRPNVVLTFLFVCELVYRPWQIHLMIKTSAISSSLLALAPLDEETQIGSFLFASSHSRWLRKVQSGVTEADIIGPNFAYGNVALWEGLSSKHLPGPVLLNFSVRLWTGVSTMANPVLRFFPEPGFHRTGFSPKRVFTEPTYIATVHRSYIRWKLRVFTSYIRSPNGLISP